MANITAESIYEVLGRQAFADWYGVNTNDVFDCNEDEDHSPGDFELHIGGDEGCKTKDEILDDIQRMFGVERA